MPDIVRLDPAAIWEPVASSSVANIEGQAYVYFTDDQIVGAVNLCSESVVTNDVLLIQVPIGRVAINLSPEVLPTPVSSLNYKEMSD